MAEKQQRLTQVLDCSICRDILNEPVALPACQHVFCRPCIQTFVDSAQRDNQSLRCPECRRPIRLGEEGVPGLPLQHRLVAIATHIQEEPQPFRCEIHGRPHSTFCLTCNEPLCQGCLAKHDMHRLRDIKLEAESAKVFLWFPNVINKICERFIKIRFH